MTLHVWCVMIHLRVKGGRHLVAAQRLGLGGLDLCSCVTLGKVCHTVYPACVGVDLHVRPCKKRVRVPPQEQPTKGCTHCVMKPVAFFTPRPRGRTRARTVGKLAMQFAVPSPTERYAK